MSKNQKIVSEINNESKNAETKKITEISADELNLIAAMKKGAEKIKPKEGENFEYQAYKKEITKNINFLNAEYEIGLSSEQIKHLQDNLSDFLVCKSKYGEEKMLKIYKSIRSAFQKFYTIQKIENPKLASAIKNRMQSHLSGKDLDKSIK